MRPQYQLEKTAKGNTQGESNFTKFYLQVGCAMGSFRSALKEHL